MSTMASQITSHTIVYLTVYSRRKSKKTSKLHVTGLGEGNSQLTGEFPAQRASNAENVSIWWRHHGKAESACIILEMYVRHQLMHGDLFYQLQLAKPASNFGYIQAWVITYKWNYALTPTTV